MKLHLVAFGKLKAPGLREAADYYLRNIAPWVTVQEHELKPLSVPDKSPSTRVQIQEKEGELLIERLSPLLGSRGAFYLMDEVGKAHTTQAWAQMVRHWESESTSAVALCLGSSLGWSPALRGKARGLLSLGPQTLPHELARVVLLEQAYRAWSVVRGHPYHNEG